MSTEAQSTASVETKTTTTTTTSSSSSSSSGGSVSFSFSLEVVLRVLAFVCALISFACMASYPFYEYRHDTEFLLAAGVLTFIWQLAAILVAALLRAKVDALCGYWAHTAVALDAIFAIFMLAGSAACADLCRKFDGFCDAWGEVPASAAFGFLTLVFLVALVVVGARAMMRK